MTTWFVSRHPGALEWMQRHGPVYDRHVPHLQVGAVQTGDVVIGTLPLNLAAMVCQRGAQYWHLSMALPQAARGRELSVGELEQLGLRLARFDVRQIRESHL